MGTAVMRGRVVASTTLLAFPPAEYSTTEIVDVITRDLRTARISTPPGR
jgi:hypothetical protein